VRQVELYINNQTIDYNELKSIPASLRKRTDKFLEIVGADGAEVDNVLKSLAIPDTPNNQPKLQSLMQQSALGRGATRVSVKLVVNGIMLFAGPGILKKASKKSGAAASHLVELLGDGLSLWEKLEGKSLRDLDGLGAITWTFTETLANWNDTDFSIYKAWWCPAVYGTERGTGTFDIKDFRPSVGYRPIVDAIFLSQGYTIVSEFFDTYFFRRNVHLFGVGDQWKIDFDVSGYYFKGSFGASTTLAIALGTAHITLLFDPDDDPHSMYHNNGEPQLDPSPPSFPGSPTNVVNDEYVQWLQIPVTGIWKFRVRVNTQDASELQVFVVRSSVNVIDKKYQVGISADGAPGVTVEFEYLVEANDEVFMYLYGTVIVSGVGVRSRIRHTFVSATMLNKPFIGSDVALSSCLPDEDQKAFLRGISHQFNLAWQVDDVTRRVFVEPRFDYTLIEDGVPVVRKGFYRRDYPLKTYEIDAEQVEVEYVSPLGESLRMGYKDDSSDPMEKATLAELQRSDQKKQPPYYCDIELFDRGVKGLNSPNPYFTTLYQGKPSDIQLREDSYLPLLLPSSYKRGDKLPGMIWTPPGEAEKREEMPTYETSPKCGIMFPDALSFAFHYDDSETTYYSEGARAPWVTQQKWQDMGGGPALADWDTDVAYADLEAKDTARNIRGLVSSFYPNYISIIKEGQQLKGVINMPLPTIAALSYRHMARLPFDSNESIWILLELANYKALLGDECDGTFIKYVAPKKEDMDVVTYDDPDLDPIVPDIAPEDNTE